MTSTVSALGTGTTSYSYDANDRLSPDLNDNNGNTTLSGGVSNTYDFENRMTVHGTTTMVYDGDGNRVSESVGGATTKYLVDTLNPTGLPQVLDETVNSSVTRTYGYGLQRISENQLNGSTWTPSFYGYDGHGNVPFLSNSAGTVTDTYQYDAFGRLIATGNTPNNFEYSGEQFDSSVGLYNLRARYYNHVTGRFVTRDPIEGAPCSPLTNNPYIYGNDDPVDRVDPLGQESVLEKATFEDILFLTVLTGAYYASKSKGVSVGGIEGVGRTTNCEDYRIACGFTTLADWWRYPGRTYGANRCQQCYDVCIETGKWPKRAPVTGTRKSVRCDYWNFPSKSQSE